MPVAAVDLAGNRVSVGACDLHGGADRGPAVDSSSRMAGAHNGAGRPFCDRQAQTEPEEIAALTAFVTIVGRGPTHVGDNHVQFAVTIDICDRDAAARI